VGTIEWLTDLGVHTTRNELVLAADWMNQGASVVWVARNLKLLGFVAVQDQLRTEAQEVVQTLRSRGVDVWMVTGDQPASAELFARRLGITRVFSQVLPDEKARLVRELQGWEHRVAMVGDGINDAPALAQADLGISLSSGTDIAMEAGHITLMHADLRGVPRALELAQATLRIIRWNLFFAFLYNSLAIPLAALNLLDPMVASAAMALSSLSVVGNSLRLRAVGNGGSLPVQG
jgi:P-type E1-E2 ATPase